MYGETLKRKFFRSNLHVLMDLQTKIQGVLEIPENEHKCISLNLVYQCEV
jgi:hypothetical protein